MITELRIENFKSLGSGMHPLTLRPLNFIVGANASGKTNLISALRFLKIAMLQSVEVAANEYGGIAEVRNKILRERDTPKPLRITLRVKVPTTGRFRSRQGAVYSISSYHYRVEIDLRASDGGPVILSELLEAELALPDKQTATFQLKRSRESFTVLDPLAGTESRKHAVEEDDATRLVAGTSFIGPIVGRFRRFIERWAFFNINPDVVRLASKDVVDPDLGESGESLATILHLMEKSGNGGIANLVQGLRGAVPSFKSVRSRPQEAEGKRTFQVIEERLRAGINPHAVSDGTVRLLALMVIVYWSAKRASLIAIEEPETGLHPHLARNVVELLRTAAASSQVLVTTHNPDFLDELGRTLGARHAGGDSMTIGVGVEGPSDFQFWDKVLHKHFRGHRFDVRNMKNRDKLIRETPRLMESFRDCHYAAGFSLVDMDDDPCISSVLDLFDGAVRTAARTGDRAARSFHVCVAIKEIESWYLADATAIQALMPECEWSEAPEDTFPHLLQGWIRPPRIPARLRGRDCERHIHAGA